MFSLPRSIVGGVALLTELLDLFLTGNGTGFDRVVGHHEYATA
jgi:hypothetical protein